MFFFSFFVKEFLKNALVHIICLSMRIYLSSYSSYWILCNCCFVCELCMRVTVTNHSFVEVKGLRPEDSETRCPLSTFPPLHLGSLSESTVSGRSPPGTARKIKYNVLLRADVFNTSSFLLWCFERTNPMMLFWKTHVQWRERWQGTSCPRLVLITVILSHLLLWLIPIIVTPYYDCKRILVYSQLPSNYISTLVIWGTDRMVTGLLH